MTPFQQMAKRFVALELSGKTHPRVFTVLLLPCQNPLTSTSISRYSQPRGSGKPWANNASAAERMLVGTVPRGVQGVPCCGGRGGSEAERPSNTQNAKTTATQHSGGFMKRNMNFKPARHKGN